LDELKSAWRNLILEIGKALKLDVVLLWIEKKYKKKPKAVTHFRVRVRPQHLSEQERDKTHKKRKGFPFQRLV